MNRLVLIDGNAILHRAYHAIPPLTAPDGSVVNAVYGFATMLFRLFNDLKPTHMAITFDRAAPTFRKKLFEGYQAKRPKMDDELVGQIDKVHELVEAFGIPVFEKDGYEADDVIGSLCQQVKSRKLKVESEIDQVIIVTGDRDILQLVVDEKVLVYMPTKGLSEAKLYGEKDVVERMGVMPKLIPDLKGLMGDASDNYPGVEGIGPKTAVSLLNQYGSIKGIYRSLKEFKGKKLNGVSDAVVEKLTAGEESALLSQNLATIRTNVKIVGSVTTITTLNTAQARNILEILHFHSLLKRLSGETETYEKKEKGKSDSKEKKSGEQQQLF